MYRYWRTYIYILTVQSNSIFSLTQTNVTCNNHFVYKYIVLFSSHRQCSIKIEVGKYVIIKRQCVCFVLYQEKDTQLTLWGRVGKGGVGTLWYMIYRAQVAKDATWTTTDGTALQVSERERERERDSGHSPTLANLHWQRGQERDTQEGRKKGTYL